MSEKLGLAVIGCGNISRSHIPSYLKLDNVEVRYFCDIIPERADKAVETYGCGKAVYDYKELLGHDDIDIVSVCTHNDCHAPISIDFMRDGKDVLCRPQGLSLRLLKCKRLLTKQAECFPSA